MHDDSKSRTRTASLGVTMLLTENQVKQSAYAVTSFCVRGTEPLHREGEFKAAFRDFKRGLHAWQQRIPRDVVGRFPETIPAHIHL